MFWRKERNMRPIKFRGKSKLNGEWHYGNLFVSDTRGRTHISTPARGCLSIAPDTVGQFTGLYDKNGQEIYEGDIITLKGLYPRVVLWDKMMWALMPTDYYQDNIFWVMNLQHPGVDWWEEYTSEFEVIGNIHDNPELINHK